MTRLGRSACETCLNTLALMAMNHSESSSRHIPAVPSRPQTSARTSSCSVGCTAFATSARFVFIDLRDRHGITQVVVRERDAGRRGRSGCGPEYVIAVLGHVEARSPETVNPKIEDRRDRGRRARDPAAQRREDAAVLDRRRAARRRTRGCASLSRSAAPADAAEHRPAPPVAMAVRRYFDAHGFLEIETPMLDEVDARGRARLPRAEPRPPGRVLRPLPQSPQIFKQILMIAGWIATSRSSSASATRICAPIASRSSRRSTSRSRSRPRTLVFSTIEPLMERSDGAHRSGEVTPPFRACLCGGDAATDPTSRTALRHGDR